MKVRQINRINENLVKINNGELVRIKKETPATSTKSSEMRRQQSSPSKIPIVVSNVVTPKAPALQETISSGPGPLQRIVIPEGKSSVRIPAVNTSSSLTKKAKVVKIGNRKIAKIWLFGKVRNFLLPQECNICKDGVHFNKREFKVRKSNYKSLGNLRS